MGEVAEIDHAGGGQKGAQDAAQSQCVPQPLDAEHRRFLRCRMPAACPCCWEQLSQRLLFLAVR